MSYESDSLPPSYYPCSMYPIPTQSDVSIIRDYLGWSIVNLLFGYGLFGIIPLVFSLTCRNEKSNNNFHAAKTMSTFALVFNILVTIAGVLLWTFLIIYLAIFRSLKYY